MDKFKQFLKNIAPITDNDFADTISFFTKLNLQKGDFFVKQDKVCQHIAFIVKGTLRIFYINNKGEETTSCFCTENNFTTSYKSFILQQPSNLSIQAIEETELLVIDYNNLQKLYKSRPIWQNIGRTVAERECIVMEKYASVLNNETAKEKYLRLLQEQPIVIQKQPLKILLHIWALREELYQEYDKKFLNNHLRTFVLLGVKISLDFCIKF